jgi:hypothetical protein
MTARGYALYQEFNLAERLDLLRPHVRIAAAAVCVSRAGVSFCVSIQVHLFHLSASSMSLARPMSTIPSFKLIVQRTGWLLYCLMHGCGSCGSWRRIEGARSTAPRQVVTLLVHPSMPALLALAPCCWRATLIGCRAHRASKLSPQLQHWFWFLILCRFPGRRCYPCL